jgi:hypothetical protein
MVLAREDPDIVERDQRNLVTGKLTLDAVTLLPIAAGSHRLHYSVAPLM